MADGFCSTVRLPVLLLLACAAAIAQPADPAERTKQARELVIAGRAEEAVPIFEDLVQASPNDAGLRMSLCIAQFKAGRFRDSIAQAEAALRLQPGMLTARLFLGASYLELGDPGRAAEPLQKVVAAQPKERNAQLMLAEAMRSLNRYEEAAEHFRAAIALMPENAKAWYGLGRSLEALSGQALDELEQTAPDCAYRHALTAEALLRQRRYGSALHHYRDALARDAGLRGVHAGLATLYKETGRPALAAAEEEAGKRMPPPDCAARKLECDFAAGRLREVIGAARQSASPEAYFWSSMAYRGLAAEAYARLENLPDSAESHIYAATIHESRSLYTEAIREWRLALKLAPDDANVRTGLAVALFHGRDYTAALPLLDGLLRQRPESADLNFLYGASVLNMEQPEKAVPYLERALKQDARYLPARAALGQAYLRIGKAAQAIPHLKESLATDEDGSRHFQLVRAYQLAGETDLAKKALADYQTFRKTMDAKKSEEEGLDLSKP